MRTVELYTIQNPYKQEGESTQLIVAHKQTDNKEQNFLVAQMPTSFKTFNEDIDTLYLWAENNGYNKHITAFKDINPDDTGLFGPEPVLRDSIVFLKYEELQEMGEGITVQTIGIENNYLRGIPREIAPTISLEKFHKKVLMVQHRKI